MYIFLGYLFGFLGISIGIFIQLGVLSNLKSFGVSYLSPYTPVINLYSNVSFFQRPIWKKEYRPDFLNTKRPVEEAHISRQWKFKNRRR